MKVAARFPVKTYTPLILAIVLFHIMLLLISLVEFGFSWQQIIVSVSLLISLYFSFKQYWKITQSPDDLCWTGESWLMHQGNKLNGAVYLDLEPTSWVSNQLALLHFSCTDGVDVNDSVTANKKYHWLFSRHELGERMYSQLVYLVRQNIKVRLKAEES